MYIFNRVVGKVVATGIDRAPVCYEFDFYRGTETKAFGEAKKVADPDFLADRVAALTALYNEQREGTVELTSETSKIRGYQGGLVHLLFNEGNIYLVSPLRGADAPSSPLMLDIQAGRLNFDNAEEQGDSWEDSIFRKGFEVGYITTGNRIIPRISSHYPNPEMYEPIGQRNRSIGQQFSSAYPIAVPDVDLPFEKSTIKLDLWADDGTCPPEHINPFAPRITIHKEVSREEVLLAGWAVLPYVSSIEIFKYIGLEIEGDIRFTDMNIDKGKAVQREIYVINCETGQTQVWKAGALLQTEDISTLLEENREILERLHEQGKLRDGIVAPVSPKLRAAIEQLPMVLSHGEEVHYRGLQKILQY